MRDDYLWDKKGEPDRDVEELERALGQFRQAVPPPDFQAVPVEAAPLPSRRTPRWLALAAAVGLVGSPRGLDRQPSGAAHGPRGQPGGSPPDRKHLHRGKREAPHRARIW